MIIGFGFHQFRPNVRFGLAQTAICPTLLETQNVKLILTE